jgi:membrane-bound metal-dependent hydrolase YbcI (DUF457 family)
MMGRQHCLAACATWLTAAPLLDNAVGLTTAQTVVGLGLAAGSGMLPDFDMPGSTIARTYGPVTNVIARVVALAAGGHRWGTHCLVGVAVMGAAAYATTVYWVALAVAVWLLLGTGARAMGMTDADGPGRIRGPRWWRHLVGAFTNAAVMAVVTLATIIGRVDTAEILTVAVVLGAGSHLFTDCLTEKGCPLFLPFSRRKIRFAKLTTGGRSSKAVTAVLAVLVVACALGAPAALYGLALGAVT